MTRLFWRRCDLLNGFDPHGTRSDAVLTQRLSTLAKPADTEQHGRASAADAVHAGTPTIPMFCEPRQRDGVVQSTKGVVDSLQNVCNPSEPLPQQRNSRSNSVNLMVRARWGEFAATAKPHQLSVRFQRTVRHTHPHEKFLFGCTGCTQNFTPKTDPV